MLITLFKPLRPDAVEVIVRVVAEGDHGLGAGDARDLGNLLGDYLREPLELRDADHDDEVIGSGHRVDLCNALDPEHGLGGLLDPLVLCPHQDDRRYQDPRLPLILNTERHRAREGVVFLAPLVPDGAYPDAGLGGLVVLAGLEAPDLHGGGAPGLYALDGSRDCLTLGPGVEDDLHRDVGLGGLAAVGYRHGENDLVGAREDHVPARGQRPAGDLDARDPYVAQGA